MIRKTALVWRQSPIDIRETELPHQIEEAVLDILSIQWRHWMAFHNQPHRHAIRRFPFATEICPQMQIEDILEQLEVRPVPQQRA